MVFGTCASGSQRQPKRQKQPRLHWPSTVYNAQIPDIVRGLQERNPAPEIVAMGLAIGMSVVCPRGTLTDFARAVPNLKPFEFRFPFLKDRSAFLDRLFV